MRFAPRSIPAFALLLALSSLGCDKLLNNRKEAKKENEVTQKVVNESQQTVPVANDVTQKVPQAAKSKYAVRDKVVVLWKGTPYNATITVVHPNERYSIHYDGWGSEWDEVVGLSRITGKR